MTDLERFLEFTEKAQLDCRAEEIAHIIDPRPPGVYERDPDRVEPPLDPDDPPEIGWSYRVNFCGVAMVYFYGDGSIRFVLRTFDEPEHRVGDLGNG